MTWRFVGANFDQMHMQSNLRWIREHPSAELVGVCDEDPETSTGSLDNAVRELDIPSEMVYDDLDRCLERTDPDVVIGCPMNSLHADFVERVAAYDVHVAIEKPFATTVADADRMLAAFADTDKRLAVNWPSAWKPETHEIRHLLEGGTVGDVFEIQYYGGNGGAPPNDSWFYEADKGGGSLLDYLGYGVTLATWLRNGDLPDRVTAETHVPEHLDVDVQSSTICQYGEGISVFQTSWRMFTHPWVTPPQPARGYDIVGTEGTISTRDREGPIRVQTREEPEGFFVEPGDVPTRYETLVHYLISCFEDDEPFEGLINPEFNREVQRIIEAARKSADEGQSIRLAE